MLDEQLTRVVDDGRGDVAAALGAVAALRSAAADEGDRAACDVAEALLLHVAGRHEDALAQLGHALFVCEDLGRVRWAARGWGGAAQLFAAQGLTDDALSALDHAEGLSADDGPTLAHLRRIRAGTLRRLGHLDEAGALYDNILAEPPILGSAQRDRDAINAASTWQQLGRLDDADRALREVGPHLDQALPDVRIWYRIILAWTRWRQGDADSALRALAPLDEADLTPEAASSALRCLALAVAEPPVDRRAIGEVERRLEAVLQRPELAASPDQVLWLRTSLADLATARGDTVSEQQQRQLAEESARLRAELDTIRRRGRNALNLSSAQRAVQLAGARRALADLEAERAALLQRLTHQNRRLSTLRHDVANELTLISAWLPSEDDLTAFTPEDAARLRGSIDRLGETVLGAIDAERGAMLDPHTRTVDVAEVARTLSANVGGLADKRGLRIRVSADAPVVSRADRPSVVRILENLLSNELRYAVPGVIDVEADVHGGQARLVVRDQGPGLPKDLVVGAYRSHAIGRTRGSGLGLYAVRTLVEALGGVFRTEPSGHGTAFVVSLPLLDLDTRSGPG